MRKSTRLLKGKAISSIRRAAQAFNGLDDDGRTTTTLLHVQHSFEMLMKAALNEKGERLFDSRTGRSIGYARCINLCMQYCGLREEAAGTLRVVDALRDDEQHFLGGIAEGVLYLHMR